MPINFVTGLPRAGKTLFTLVQVKARAEKENRQVYTCNIPGITIPGWETIEHPDKWLDLPDGAIIVVDELQDFWPKQPSGSKVPLPILELSKHGKRGFDFYFITQEPNLVHSTPRDLCAVHWYVVRAWGAHAAAVYRFERCQLRPERAKRLGERTPWVYPKEAFAWYKSADVHNIKRQLPRKLLIFPAAVAVLVLAVVGMVWGYGQMQASAKGAGASQMSKGSSGVGGATGEVGGPRAATLTAAEYMAAYQPRIRGLAHTAPAYDGLTAPKRVPVPAACMESQSKGCRCWTQDATPYDTTPEICRQVVRSGIFLAFAAEGERKDREREAKPATAAPSAPQGVKTVPESPGLVLIGGDGGSASAKPSSSTQRSGSVFTAGGAS